jgi:YbbR domain-containing protein
MGAVSFIPRFITHNASLKLLALLGATFLWAIAPDSPDGSETLADIPVRVQVGDPAWLVVGAPEPSRVTIRVSGPTREIIRLAREGTSVRVEVDEVTSPDSIVRLRRDWVVLSGSPALVVEEVVPTEVRVRFEESASATLPVAVRTRGSLPVGTALAFPLGTTPGVVRVSGPARLVRGLESIPTAPVDLSGVSESEQRELALDLSGLDDALVTPRTVSVGIRVADEVERLLSPLTVFVEEAPDFEVLLDPEEVEVVVRGAQARLEAAGLESLEARIDGTRLEGMSPGETRWVPVSTRGVPDLLRATAVPDSILVIRPVAQWEEDR